jgi:hypothetical protein
MTQRMSIKLVETCTQFYFLYRYFFLKSNANATYNTIKTRKLFSDPPFTKEQLVPADIVNVYAYTNSGASHLTVQAICLFLTLSKSAGTRKITPPQSRPQEHQAYSIFRRYGGTAVSSFNAVSAWR